ncbi:hypothetical protein PWR63_31560 [Paraburkholderia sp. A2WS-5]|uniref:hypothetical protein n=1 Tax=unclassified Paraburkholderia TaxID=2615204 RepID=UPI003B78FA51
MKMPSKKLAFVEGVGGIVFVLSATVSLPVEFVETPLFLLLLPPQAASEINAIATVVFLVRTPVFPGFGIFHIFFFLHDAIMTDANLNAMYGLFWAVRRYPRAA